MKWVALAGLCLISAFLAGVLRSKPGLLPRAAFLLGLAPFIEDQFHLLSAPISWAAWPGEAKGIAISMTDALAFAILLASPRAKSPVALRVSLGLFIVAYLVSTISTGVEMASIFSGWEIIRAVVLYMAVARACATNKNVAEGMFTGLVAGVCIQAVVATYQYSTGSMQAPGWLGHQNLLGYSLHFVLYPAVALFLGGFCKKRALLAVFASLIIAFTGASRATIGLSVAGIFLTLIFSSWHHYNGRKIAVVFAALLGLLVASPILYSAVGRRSVEQKADSNKARELMMSAAGMMVDDYPLGVGANRYVLVANLGGYSERAGVPWNVGNRSAPVHNAYYLITAEFGWLGLLAFVTLLASAIMVALRVIRRASRSFGGELAAGTVVTFVMVAVHSYFEWIFMEHLGHTFFALSLGLVSALNALLRQNPALLPRLRHAQYTPASMPSEAAAVP